MTSEELVLPVPGVLLVYVRGAGGVPKRIVARIELKRHRDGKLATVVEVDEGLSTWVSTARDDLVGQRQLDFGAPRKSRRSDHGGEPAA